MNNETTYYDNSKALQYFSDAAIQGDRDAQLNLAYIYHNGIAVEKDLVKAISWYQKAAKQSCIMSQFPLGVIFKNQEKYTDSINYFRKAAEQNHGDAQYFLGWLYQKDLGTEENIIEAQKWYRKSQSQEDYTSSILLAKLYHCNDDIKKEMEWYKKALYTKHISSAERELGLIYEDGKDITFDYKEAFELFTKSAVKGNRSACYKIGRMYYYGKGIEKNTEEVLTWFKKANSGPYNSTIKHIFSELNIFHLSPLRKKKELEV